jgi:hypothetical protein
MNIARKRRDRRGVTGTPSGIAEQSPPRKHTLKNNADFPEPDNPVIIVYLPLLSSISTYCAKKKIPTHNNSTMMNTKPQGACQLSAAMVVFRQHRITIKLLYSVSLPIALCHISSAIALLFIDEKWAEGIN